MDKHLVPFGLALNTLAFSPSPQEKVKALVQYVGCFSRLLEQLGVPVETTQHICVAVLIELAKGQGLREKVMKGFEEVHAHLSSDDFLNAGSCRLKH